MMEVVELREEHGQLAEDLLIEAWGSTTIITRGRAHDAGRLPGFLALQDGTPVGLVTLDFSEDECELITINSLVPGLGVGSALLTESLKSARQAGCRRLWLVTTNDNMAALRFYQKQGFHLVALYRDALEGTRRLKPSLSLIGLDGIPLRDEIELEFLLEGGRESVLNY